MATRPAPPPLLIANIPCPGCRIPTGFDPSTGQIFCNYCGLLWATAHLMLAVGDEVPGQWAGAEPTQHNALNVPEQEEQP